MNTQSLVAATKPYGAYYTKDSRQASVSSIYNDMRINNVSAEDAAACFKGLTVLNLHDQENYIIAELLDSDVMSVDSMIVDDNLGYTKLSNAYPLCNDEEWFPF